MDLKNLNQKLQTYDKNLSARWINVKTKSPSLGFEYKTQTIQVMERGVKSGDMYEVFTVPPQNLREDYILYEIKSRDSYKGGAKSFDELEREDNKNRQIAKQREDADMHEVNVDIAKYVTKKPKTINFKNK